MTTEPEKPGPSDKEPAEGPAGTNPVKEMFILAALYLPLAFFLWFFFASAVTYLPGRVAELVLVGLFPGVFERVVQLEFKLEIQTLIELSRRVDGRVPLLNLMVNPMIYGWGLPLLFGLIMATPLSAGRRILQLLVGFVVSGAVMVWGIFWESWRDLAFLMGPEAAEVVAESVMNPTLIALCYQLGALMLPGVVPVAAWILMNWPFLEKVVFERAR